MVADDDTMATKRFDRTTFARAARLRAQFTYGELFDRNKDSAPAIYVAAGRSLACIVYKCIHLVNAVYDCVCVCVCFGKDDDYDAFAEEEEEKET